MVTTSCQAHTKANKKQGHHCCTSAVVSVCVCVWGLFTRAYAYLVHSFIWPGCAKSFIHSPTNIVHCSACVSAGTAPIEPYQDGFLDSNDWISLNGNRPHLASVELVICCANHRARKRKKAAVLHLAPVSIVNPRQRQCIWSVGEPDLRRIGPKDDARTVRNEFIPVLIACHDVQVVQGEPE